MELLRLATSGSVDDGKSTLIGRLLYETGQVPADRLDEVELRSRQRGLEYTDLALLTDGLLAEREQGITIDVAHIYFNTPKRKYIIADTPGHEEYTRNMVTGASQSHVALVLVDARHGVVRQTRRHLYIAAMLKLPHVVVVVNKMDLVNYDAEVFERHQQELQELAERFEFKGALNFVPVSALKGDGVVKVTEALAWYKGPALLDLLEGLELPSSNEDAPKFQVQTVLRPQDQSKQRGYAGVLSAGTLRKGDKLFLSNTGDQVTVAGLDQWGNSLDASGPNRALTVHLEEDVNVPRGTWLLNAPQSGTRAFSSRITWLDRQGLNPASTYLLQHGTDEVACKVSGVRQVLDMDSLEPRTASQVSLNDVADVELKTQRAMPLEDYRFGERTGAFVLIDSVSRSTVAAGVVTAATL